MSLARVWIPSGNYSGGSKKDLLVIHSMEGFTGGSGAYDCARYFQGDVGASSQVCIDNTPGKIWECVSRNNGSWTQCNYNGKSVSCEQSGYASWSRDYWLGNREPQLRNIAAWIAEEAKHFGIPITLLNSSQAQGGGRGVCYHSHLGGDGCGHSDPGSGWPADKVIEWAKGGGGTAPAPDTEMAGINMPACVYSRGLHQVGIWQDGRPHYQFEGEGWYQIDRATPPFKALSGADICITPAGMLVVSVTGLDKNLWTFQQQLPEGGGAAVIGKWGKYSRGGHNSLR